MKIKFQVSCLEIQLIIMLIILDMAQMKTTYRWCTDSVVMYVKKSVSFDKEVFTMIKQVCV